MNNAVSHLIFLILALTISCSKSEDSKGGGSGGKRSGGQAIRVEAIVAKHEQLKTSVRGVGILQASKEVEIQSEITGRVQAIYFKDGQNVKSGYYLVKVEDANLRAAMEKANAKLTISRNMAQRKKQQFNSGAISAQEWELAQADLQVAEADSIDAAANLQKTLMTAPFEGKLGISKVNVGKRLSVGEPVVNIVQKFPLKVDFSVADKYAPILRPGMEVEFSRDKTSYKAIIEAVEGSLDGSTRTLQARAIISGQPEELVPGTPLEFSLDLPARESITVPPESISSDALGSTVFLYKGGKAELARILLGTRFVDKVEVQSGIAIGDTVLRTGASPVRNGGDVEVTVRP
ncbi:MAG: efflux RND transporter periplasmic adaptor subunit [Fibromonadaceae bacterium]|jgi:membrane fusion protein (multidrug efflux system)|nr:efflux RND transporter periplasmic adaptor subunit [Fibromonadaceae bacterium]